MKGNKKLAKLTGQSQLALTVFRYRKNKLAVFGLICLLLIGGIVLTAPLYMNYDRAIKQDLTNKFQSPSFHHPFGTDLFGRDLLARVIYGGRISLVAGLCVIIFAFFIGVFFGGIAGYFGGWIDQIIMRFIDIFMAIPQMFLVLAIVTALGEGTWKLMLALIVTNVPRYTWIVRSSIMTLRNQEFVEAAKCCGTNTWRIITKHILPNGIGPVIVTATITLGTVILNISSLGFLGVGIAPPTPEWGILLADNRFYLRYYPYLGILPGFAIILTVMCVNFIGDGLRDALDPKMKK